MESPEFTIDGVGGAYRGSDIIFIKSIDVMIKFVKNNAYLFYFIGPCFLPSPVKLLEKRKNGKTKISRDNRR